MTSFLERGTNVTRPQQLDSPKEAIFAEALGLGVRIIDVLAPLHNFREVEVEMGPGELSLTGMGAAVCAAELFRQVDKGSRLAVRIAHSPTRVTLDHLITDK